MEGCCCLREGNGTFGSWEGVGPVCRGPNPISQEADSQCHQILKALNSIHHDKEPGASLERPWSLAWPSPPPALWQLQLSERIERKALGLSTPLSPGRPSVWCVRLCQVLRGLQEGERYLGSTGLGMLLGGVEGQGEGKCGTCGRRPKGRSVGVSGCWGPPASETLGHFLSPVAAHSVPFWGGVT